MATLQVRLNRIKNEKSKRNYYLSFLSKEKGGIHELIVNVAEYVRDVSYYGPVGHKNIEKTCTMLINYKYLNTRFPGILGSNVINKKETTYGEIMFQLDYITENYYQERYDSLLCSLTKGLTREKISFSREKMSLAKEFLTLFPENESNLLFLKDLRTCDKYDLKALNTGLYCLKHGIRATKVRYAYGARRCWEHLGFKLVILKGVRGVREDNGKRTTDSNYVFLIERS